ncbi:MAG: Ig-like domain-containing protein [Oscillospiraceae bacterium]|nr:Ig-like domain-containing protein [Oscillospiraceae bacterium]
MGYDYYPDRPLIVEDTEVIISYGGESTNIPITVTPVKPTGVTLNRTALTLFVGYSGIILETVLPDNAADKKVTWSSDDLTVASVDEFGVVTALAEGTAIITATTIEGDFSASCRIDVVLETSSLITVSSATALRDKTVTVNIDIENNPGFAGMTLKVSFPKELTLTRYDLGDMDLIFGFTGPDGVLPGAACDISDQLYLVWGRTSNYTQDGTIVTLTFSIANDAQPGEYPVLVTFEQHNGPRTPVNLQETPLDIYIMDGTIIALRCILGNVTDSGEVGPADLVRLARWIAGHQGVYINEFAADITGRGEIGPADLVRLARWIAGHFGDMTLEELRTRPDTGGSQ